jgi:hypothetical protein
MHGNDLACHFFLFARFKKFETLLQSVRLAELNQQGITGDYRAEWITSSWANCEERLSKEEAVNHRLRQELQEERRLRREAERARFPSKITTNLQELAIRQEKEIEQLASQLAGTKTPGPQQPPSHSAVRTCSDTREASAAGS